MVYVCGIYIYILDAMTGLAPRPDSITIIGDFCVQALDIPENIYGSYSQHLISFSL